MDTVKDIHNGRRMLVILKPAIIHKRRYAVGELAYQWWGPTDVTKLVGMKTARLATASEIARAFEADEKNEKFIVPEAELHAPVGETTGVPADESAEAVAEPQAEQEPPPPPPPHIPSAD